MNLPIRARMTLWYLALLALIIAAVGAFLVLRLQSDLTNALDRDLVPASAQLAHGYRVEGPPEFTDTAGTVLSGERAAAQVLSPAGQVLVRYGDPVADTPMLSADARRAVLSGAVLKRTVSLDGGGDRFRIAARRTERHGERQVVVAGGSLAPVSRAVHRVLVLLLLAGPAALLLTALGGWWLARRALRPIDRLTTAADAVGVDQLDRRIDVPAAADEVGRLARTLNTMLERIQTGVEEQRRLVADASHELRTPLAAMRSEIDVSLRNDELSPAAREVLESTREEVDRMSAIVADLLTLASVDEGTLVLVSEPADLRDLAELVADTVRPLAQRRGVTIEIGGDPAPVRVDPERARHVLRNLLANAIRFSPPGGEVEVVTTLTGGRARAEVVDQGPGVPPELRERIFDRFFRGDPSRSQATGGSGLGLAIAREITLAHGGAIGVEAREPRGSRFWVEFPVDPAAQAVAPPGPGEPVSTLTS